MIAIGETECRNHVDDLYEFVMNYANKNYCIEQINQNTVKLYFLDPESGPVFSKMVNYSFEMGKFDRLHSTMNNDYWLVTDVFSRSNEDFPAPLGPINTTFSPCSIDRDTSFRAAVPSG